MAAHASVTSLSKTKELLNKIIFLSIERPPNIRSAIKQPLKELQKEIESLHEDTKELLSSLEKPFNKSTDQLEAQAKDATDEAQRIIRRLLKHLRSNSAADDALTLKGLCLQLLRARERISSAVLTINNMFDEMLRNIQRLRQLRLSRKGMFVGVRNVFEELSHLVIKGSSAELRAVPILGMGGIGKTTLAREFYNDATTCEVFEIRCWVMVSKDFSARDILVSLVASIQPFVKKPKQSNETIEVYVQNNLRGRRFLIVLDDVWSREALDFLMRIFPDDGNGSRVLITTRQREVAESARDPMHVVTMRFMNRRESFNLLLHKVFPDDECPDKLLLPMRAVSDFCKGLPLAIVLAAGIVLAEGKSFVDWVEAYPLSSLPCTEHELVDEFLSRSYANLLHHLRSCLLYMGAFPEDHEMHVSRLTKQLLAQDFLQIPRESSSSSSSSSSSYEVEECLQELVKRNLVTVLSRKSDGGIKSVCLHDMVRDFCLREAQKENFLHCATDDDVDRDLVTRRKIKVAFNFDDLKRIPISDDADDTHTIMCFGRGRGRGRGPLVSLTRFRLLKSLDLVRVELASFPIEVLDLPLLRLLVLSHVPELPPSISHLKHLETLIVNPRDPSSGSITSLPKILCLPFEIWTMPLLRHIISFSCGALPDPKEGNPPLENLQTLNAVMNLNCSDALVEMIPNVKKLGIFYFNVEHATHSVKNLGSLNQLEKLKLWVLVPFSSPQDLNLGFPVTLRKLTLMGIRLSHRDADTISRLPYLKSLKLKRIDFEGDEWRVTGYGFPNLKYLLLEELGLRRWTHDRLLLLPRLEALVVRKCNELREITDGVRFIQTLELIEVVGCKKSLVESARRIKNERKFSGRYVEVVIKNYG